MGRPRHVLVLAAGVGALAVLLGRAGAAVPPTVAPPPAPAAAAATDPTVAPVTGDGPLGHEGRWFVDGAGRVVGLHGVNMVEKDPAVAPVPPAATGFDHDDAAFLREQGLNVVRLGVVFGAVMPAPGVIDTDYVASIAETVDVLAAEGIRTQIDMHQDGYGPATHGNGFPAWATLTDGLDNPPVGFPLYYVQNPALQRAFDNFWANADGPDGVPLQEHYATALATVAAAVADQPMVLGYDTMNEPWPGTVWEPCVTGCPDLEAALLAPFAERMTAAVRSADPDAFVFTEPFVLFNFGQTATSLSGFGAPRSALSFHVYALSAEADEAVIDHAIAASARGDAILATEFGATTDPATINRLTGALDTRLVPWVFWAYDEDVIVDPGAPPTPDNVREPVVAALARPYATLTNGTPTRADYDPAAHELRAGWSTERPDGAAADPLLPSVLAVPATTYPDGYTVRVTGGWVASEPGAAELEVCNAPGATAVTVTVSPGADPDPVAPRPCEPASGPTTSTTPPPATPAPAVPAAPRFTG